jgi:hypothetical protein
MVNKSELKQEYKKLVAQSKDKEAQIVLKQVQGFSNNAVVAPIVNTPKVKKKK